MSARAQLTALAGGRGLGLASSLLARGAALAALDRPLPADPRFSYPAYQAPDEILGQMTRRGLDPALVSALLSAWAERPLERALVAWDALHRSLLPIGDPLLIELRAAVRPLRAFATGRELSLDRHPAGELIAALAPALTGAHEVELLAFAFEHRLAALAELERRNDPLVRKPGTFDSLRAFAGLLHLARLPSLASVYLDFASRALGHRPAALDLCEALFDAETPQAIPGDAIRRGDVPEAHLTDVGEYLVYRTWLALGQWQKAHALCEDNLAKRDPGLPPLSTRLIAVRAHLAALAGERPIPLAVVDAAVDADPLWRHGSCCRLVVTAALSPPASARPFERLHDHLASFGPDFRAWSEALLVAPREAGWREQSLRLLAREALHLPHDPGLYRLLVMCSGTQPEISRAGEEIDERLRSQAG